ncbi:hypothetical protein ACFWIQ_36305 [Kitasatospora sp. NPDC127059]|uniref:hypothetical protein n=1 Tax=Kitasatospora sp. NPDC127059 TaxID=3347120 RepID=UPI00365BF804
MASRTGRLTAAGKREHTVSIRLGVEERAAWEAGRDAAGRKEVANWARSVINEVLTGHPGTPGEPPVVPQVNHGAYMALVRVGNDLNQLTRAVHSGGLPAGLLPCLAAAIEAVGDAALVVRGLRPVGAADQDDEDQAVEDVEPLGPGTWVDPA